MQWTEWVSGQYCEDHNLCMYNSIPHIYLCVPIHYTSLYIFTCTNILIWLHFWLLGLWSPSVCGVRVKSDSGKSCKISSKLLPAQRQSRKLGHQNHHIIVSKKIHPFTSTNFHFIRMTLIISISFLFYLWLQRSLKAYESLSKLIWGRFGIFHQLATPALWTAFSSPMSRRTSWGGFFLFVRDLSKVWCLPIFPRYWRSK